MACMKSAKHKNRPRPNTDIRHARIVDAAIMALRDDLPHSVRLAALAPKLGVSVSFISRVFTEQKRMKFSIISIFNLAELATFRSSLQTDDVCRLPTVTTISIGSD